MVIPRIFKFNFVVVVLLTFGLSPFYQRDAIRRLCAAFYLCGGDSDMQDIFYQSNISNYNCFELHIL